MGVTSLVFGVSTRSSLSGLSVVKKSLSDIVGDCATHTLRLTELSSYHGPYSRKEPSEGSRVERRHCLRRTGRKRHRLLLLLRPLVPTLQAFHPHPQGLLRGGVRQRSGDHLRFIRPLTRRDEELPQGVTRRVAQRGARLRASPGD